MRTSASQFQLLVEYMERNGDLSKPFDGAHGRSRTLKHWIQLKNLLNADSSGQTKSVEQWRKVWSDLKSNTKKKAAKIHRSTNRTGGGPASNLRLSDLEDRVLFVIGIRAATGIAEIPEVGLEEVEPGLLPLDTDDSPSILQIQQHLTEETYNNVDWNQPGPSTRPPLFPPPPLQQTREVPETIASSATQTIVSDGSEAELTRVGVPDANTGAPPYTTHQPQSPTPLPPTPRRQRRGVGLNQLSPARRRTRTQTQSDLARQAFVRSDCEWRAFQRETERERNRIRETELRYQERWLDLFQGFLQLGNRIANIFENNN